MTSEDELFACPKCGSTRIIKAGFRWSQNEWKQRYRCKDCNRRFVVTPFPGIRFSPDVAHLAVALLNKGMAREDVKDVLEKMRGVKVGFTTLYFWRQKFGKIIKQHKWRALADGSRICILCGLKLSHNEFKKGKYPSCPKRVRNQKAISSKFMVECVRPEWARRLQEGS